MFGRKACFPVERTFGEKKSIFGWECTGEKKGLLPWGVPLLHWSAAGVLMAEIGVKYELSAFVFVERTNGGRRRFNGYGVCLEEIVTFMSC
ncbi:hypothetical protein NPIL_37061 [Nephila pilipes]|uniref:Uncharacterized protein n=1 Tax=Nephila pilipes TaxID=299642 RepID=A0A8X6PAX3_NEPPI|nr:hypothetical protein NPIL_37061 [Nephila pilipes]